MSAPISPLAPDLWRDAFADWHIVSCAVVNRGCFCFALRKRIPPEQAGSYFDEQIPSRLVTLRPHAEDPRQRVEWHDVLGFSLSVCGATDARRMLMSSDGQLLSITDLATHRASVWTEDPVILRKLVRIAGRAHALGMYRDVFALADDGRWVRVDEGLPELQRGAGRIDEFLDVGFEDLDGFGPDDLYAVGGRGDVWRYDGRGWYPLDFPTNWPLFTVCCGGDGSVYISGEGGHLWRGREHEWEQIHAGDAPLPYNDSAWFDDGLWLISDDHLDRLVDGELRHAMHDEHLVFAAGHLDTHDGVLLVAGVDFVRVFDGQRWQTPVWVPRDPG